MPQAADNLRVRRTQKLLRDALIELIEEHGFETLTIGALTERALVSRAAFYRNYRDKYDLVEQIFAEAMRELQAEVGELGVEHPAGSWVAFFEHISQYERLYRALLGSQGSPWFVRKLRMSLAELIAERGRLPQHADTPAHASHRFADTFVPDLVATLFVEAISWWLEHNRPYSAHEIAARTALLAAAIFKEARTWA